MVLLGALAVTGWREHWLRAKPAASVQQHQPPQPPPGPATAIRFTSDQGIVLTRSGARYQLAAALVDASGRTVTGPVVQWRSGDPAQVSVDSAGVVTAHVAVGSATITATSAGVRPLAAQVLVARPAPGTVVVPTSDIMTTTTGQVTLRRTPLTAAITAGNILVSNGRGDGGLLARVVSVTAGTSSVTAATSPASLASAFAALSVHAMSAPAATVAPAGTTASLTADCKLAAGASGSVSLQGPSVSVPATVQLTGTLVVPQPGVVRQFSLAVQATLPITVRSGTVILSAGGSATASCELAVTDIPVPTPIFLGPVEISGEVKQAAGVDVALRGGASLTIPGPVLSDTVTADNGIQYTSAGGWSSVDHDGQSGVTVTPGPGPAAHASLSATVSPWLSAGFGVAGTLAGDNLAGTSLAFTRAEGDYQLTTPVPFSYLTPGYTGPRWNTSLGLTGGPEIALTGNLATLLQWMGLTLPDTKWDLADVTVPLQSSPSLTVTAVPGGGNGTSIRLSAALPAGLNGDHVEFVQYPPRGGQGSVVATATVSGNAATGSWVRASPPPGTRVAALVFDHVYGTAGLPYNSSTASAPVVTVVATWTPVTLPSPPGSADSYQLNGVACPAPATCVAVGYYGPQGAVRNLADTLSGGTWTPAEPSPPPLGLGDPNPALDGVSCPAPGTCVAVGQYDDQNSNPHGLVEALSGGAWTPAEPLTPPASPGSGTGLYGVSCPAPGTCVAVGGYDDQQGISQAMTETLANGAWTPAEAPLPGSPAGPGDSAALVSVSCPTPGTCVAVGYYGKEGDFQPLIETLSGGTWTPATAPRPAGQAPLGAELNGISCPAPGRCIAVGAYTVPGYAEHPLIETLSGGTWTAATAPLPAGITAATLDAVACATPASCAVAGETEPSAGGRHALLETLSGRTWAPVLAPLPAGATAGDESRLSGVACPAAGTCVATGFYTGPDGYHLLGLAETIGFAR